ncbi:ABC transporter ATP-binding protein [Candidatus Bipolaricaulota bacterium]|nr:ABC transporter ATP-binding protein [Candidatus Bipolaricaulota bacterium]
MTTAILANGLGKKYRIGHRKEADRTLRETLTDAAMAPIRRIRNFGEASHREEDTIWALRDVSFEIAQGEVVGVIGANGAGKSTLLKVLTRITEPTTGYAELRGRVGSLLEVGTGFHPELTGRDNVYLSGAVLGMTRREIAARFDEIVSFSGVEKFIDTPVKRYSSGMTVRLGFAVAAHLEPEILLVDEVLAVGDAAFRRKSLGKMRGVAESGRTVLFVSHNMAAISNLCSRALWLDDGRIRTEGDPDETVRTYLESSAEQIRSTPISERTDRSGNGSLRFTDLTIRDEQGALTRMVVPGQAVEFELHYVAEHDPVRDVNAWILLRDEAGSGVLALGTRMTGTQYAVIPREGRLVCRVPRFPLRAGTYYADLGADVSWKIKADRLERAAQVEVADGDFFGSGELLPRTTAYYCEHDWRTDGEPRGEDPQ